MLLPNRNESATSEYRYGFNGMEKDDEVTNQEGTSYDFGARFYNPRLGRWLSRDPLENRQPAWSPYKALYDSPFLYVDPQGETEVILTYYVVKSTGQVMVTMQTANNVMTDGKKHLQGSSACWYQENYYYDYASITVHMVDDEGNIIPNETETATEILYENDVKNVDEVYFGGDDEGDIITESWLTPDDEGVEVMFGIMITGGDGKPSSQDYTKNIIGSIDFETLLLLGKVNSKSLANPYQQRGQGGVNWKGSFKYKFRSTKFIIEGALKLFRHGINTGKKINDVVKEVSGSSADSGAGNTAESGESGDNQEENENTSTEKDPNEGATRRYPMQNATPGSL